MMQQLQVIRDIPAVVEACLSANSVAGGQEMDTCSSDYRPEVDTCGSNMREKDDTITGEPGCWCNSYEVPVQQNRKVW